MKKTASKIILPVLGGELKKECRSLKRISFEGLFVESYKEWEGKNPKNLKAPGKQTKLLKNIANIRCNEFFCTDKESEIMKSAGNDALKELIANNLSNYVAHSPSAKYIELRVNNEPQKLTLKPGKQCAQIPCTAWDDLKKTINNASKEKILQTWKYTPTMCKQLCQTYIE